MRIESLSIRSVTVIIFIMLAVVSIVLSILAGDYFRRAALDAQMSSLSRVIEVASQEMLRELRRHTFDLGMKLGHSRDIVDAFNHSQAVDNRNRLVALLDDPFINGFVGFARIDLQKIRIYSLDLTLVAQSNEGMRGLEAGLSEPLIKKISKRQGVERLKAIDAMWMSSKGPMHSTLVPLGGLRLAGYIEIIVNPIFNLPDIGKITGTPMSFFSASGEALDGDETHIADSRYLPIEFIMHTSDGRPAFKVVGYEDVAVLNRQMGRTQIVTITGFLLLSLSTLMFALWLFNRFLFVPLRRMVGDMKQMAEGRLHLAVDKKGLREFFILAQTFNSMAGQLRMRSNDLERLLDLDDSAILCFGHDNKAVYFNRAAARLFDYADHESRALTMTELFVENLPDLLASDNRSDGESVGKLHSRLTCKRCDGDLLPCDAVISRIDGHERGGYAIVLNPVAQNQNEVVAEKLVMSLEQSEQRMDVIEQSLNSLLAIARTNPGVIADPGRPDRATQQPAVAGGERPGMREQVVKVMQSALACWEHDLGKTKLDLAEESGIWPVYIDKSTPTTRTLDKYLHLDSCPNNPRSQRVIDTATFVLRKTANRVSEHRRRLEQDLECFRLSRSGVPGG